jgi:hypothetical protein
LNSAGRKSNRRSRFQNRLRDNRRTAKGTAKLQPTIPEHAVYFAQIAISQLERISDDDPTRGKALIMVVKWIKNHTKGPNA